MDLWIRSQDKSKLMKVDTLEIIEDVDKYVINGTGTNYDFNLGEYKTEERALEVLNEIQNLIQPIINYQPIVREKFDKKTMLLPYIEHEQVGSKTEIIQFSTYVYEMPKE